MEESYPFLKLLGLGYFHQDWVKDYASSKEVVDQFLQDSLDDRVPVWAEIDAALKSHTEEADARSFVLNDLRVSYLVESDGLTYRRWLQFIADRAHELGYGDSR